MTKSGRWLNLGIATLGVLIFVPLAVVFGYKWLAADEADRSYACGSGTRSGTCFTGETTNMTLTFVFAGIAVFGVVLTVWMARSRPRSQAGDTSGLSAMQQLQALESMRAAGLISEADYAAQRQQVIFRL